MTGAIFAHGARRDRQARRADLTRQPEVLRSTLSQRGLGL
jgi:hypothetical protein